jgi:hypothetical protein
MVEGLVEEQVSGEVHFIHKSFTNVSPEGVEEVAEGLVEERVAREVH